MYKSRTLTNGIRIVTEYIPHVRSVTLGVWIHTGSRNETKDNSGISHFIEHMLFKGTKNRTAKQIAERIDEVGGHLNAFTGKEYTCYYTKTLDTHLHFAVEILADMLLQSNVDSKDIDIEKNVILEEINMYEDAPEELVHDIFSETTWAGDSLAYPILGTKSSLEKIDRREILQYMNHHYTPANIVISVAGNFDFDTVVNWIDEKFGYLNAKQYKKSEYQDIDFNTKISYKNKDIEQTHLCMGFDGIVQGDDKIYELLVINTLLGGGMSSRLFQKIREERGLAYSVYSYPASYKKAGLFAIYAGMNPSQMPEVIKLICEEIMMLKQDKITEKELKKAKEQLKGNYILGLESTSSRMNSIGKSALLLNKIRTPDEIVDMINAITIHSVSDVIDKVFDTKKVSAAVVGAIQKDMDIKKWICF